MRCRRCGYALRERATRCASCGTSVAPQDAPASEAAVLEGLGVERYPAAADPNEPMPFGDAFILGEIGHGLTPAEVQVLAQVAPTVETLESDTDLVPRLVLYAPVYIDGSTSRLLRADSVLRRLDARQPLPSDLTPLERFVLDHIDGSRPVARLRARTGLALDDLHIALAMLAERHLIDMVGVARPDPRAPGGADEPPTDVDIQLDAGGPVPTLRPSLARAPITVSAPRPPPPRPPPPGAPVLKVQDVDDKTPDGPFRPVRPATERARPEVQLFEEASACEAHGDTEGALTLLRRALQANPRAAAVHNRLGVLLALRRREYRLAADHLMKAVELAPNNDTYRNNLEKVLGHLSSDGGKPVSSTMSSVGQALLGFLRGKRPPDKPPGGRDR